MSPLAYVDLMGDFLNFSRFLFLGVIIVIVKCTWVAIVVYVPQVSLIDAWAHLLFIRMNKLSLHYCNHVRVIEMCV